MRKTPYDAEKVLQELVGDHPEVLRGEDSVQNAGGWVLVRREAPIAEEPGRSTGALDHLFLDAAGVPTLVEVKRSSDSRIRREVVGQILDYAANAATSWTVDGLKGWLAAESGTEPDLAVVEALDGIEDADVFWETVHTNLAAGNLRLVFVADEIPSGLRRIVEFLNEQMTQTEVLAIEVEQYVDAEGQRQTIVPRVLGQTEAARQAKRPQGRRWDREAVLTELEAQRGETEASVARRIFEWASRRGDLRWWFGTGQKDGSFQAGLDDGTAYLFPFGLYTYGRVEIQFQWMLRRAPFEQIERRDEMRRQLNAIPGVDIAHDALDKRPSIPVATLTDEHALVRFLTTLDWAFEQARTAQTRA
jgi:hypothetical protein